MLQNLYDNRLYLCILLQSILAQFTTDPRLLEPTKWRSGVQDVVAIHPHRTSSDSIYYRVCLQSNSEPSDC